MFTQPTHWISPLDKSRTGREIAMPQAFSEGKPQMKRGYGTLDAALNDTIGLFIIPSSAVLSPSISRIDWSALGAGILGDIGFADDEELGVENQAAALAADIDMSAAGSQGVIELALADWDKRAAALAGLAKDPRAELLVQLTLKGGNPASGSFGFEQGYVSF